MGDHFGWPRPPAVDEVKIYDNDDKTTKHAERERIIIKILISSTAGGFGHPISF